jgi:hypothetical protein
MVRAIAHDVFQSMAVHTGHASITVHITEPGRDLTSLPAVTFAARLPFADSNVDLCTKFGIRRHVATRTTTREARLMAAVTGQCRIGNIGEQLETVVARAAVT